MQARLVSVKPRYDDHERPDSRYSSSVEKLPNSESEPEEALSAENYDHL